MARRGRGRWSHMLVGDRANTPDFFPKCLWPLSCALHLGPKPCGNLSKKTESQWRKTFPGQRDEKRDSGTEQHLRLPAVLPLFTHVHGVCSVRQACTCPARLELSTLQTLHGKPGLRHLWYLACFLFMKQKDKTTPNQETSNINEAIFFQYLK